MTDTEKGFQDVSKDLIDDFSALKADVVTLTSLVSDLAKSQAAAAKSNVYGLVDRAKDTYASQADVLTGKASDLTQKARDASGDLGGAVERNPLTALSLAFLSGLVIGMISKSAS